MAIALADFVPSAPPEPILGPLLLERETTVLYGDGDSGKSLLAAAAAFSIGTGVEVILGWRAHAGKVLILDFESSADPWWRRISRIGAGVSVDHVPRTIHYLAVPMTLSDASGEVRRVIDRIDPHLVIVDSTGFAVPPEPPGGDPKDNVIALHREINGWGRTALLIDHVSRSRSGTYGSVYKRNAVRESFELSGAAVRTLRHDKHNLRPKLDSLGLRLTFDDPSGPIRFEITDIATSGGRSRRGSLRDEVFEFVRSNPAISASALRGTFPAVRHGTLGSYLSQARKRLGVSATSVATGSHA